MLTPLYERTCWDAGRLAIGVDEAGRGALAGPVVAAAVVFHEDSFPDGIDDSKKLSAQQRSSVAQAIRTSALAWSVAMIDHQRIDEVNILQATFDAMHMAVDDVLGQLRQHQEVALLIDGNRFRPHRVPSTTIVGGDGLSPSIAAASILAKTARDQWMVNIDQMYPAYGFAVHKGYATAAHRLAVQTHGACNIHRRTFLRKIVDQPTLPFDNG